jgi:hypothetical protein
MVTISLGRVTIGCFVGVTVWREDIGEPRR